MTSSLSAGPQIRTRSSHALGATAATGTVVVAVTLVNTGSTSTRSTLQFQLFDGRGNVVAGGAATASVHIEVHRVFL
jgi:hypothetical protein